MRNYPQIISSTPTAKAASRAVAFNYSKMEDFKGKLVSRKGRGKAKTSLEAVLASLKKGDRKFIPLKGTNIQSKRSYISNTANKIKVKVSTAHGVQPDGRNGVVITILKAFVKK